MSHSQAIADALSEARALVASLESYDSTHSGPAEHFALLKQSDKVRMALEEPYDKVFRYIQNMNVTSALFILIRISALEKLPEDGSSISAATLAEACNVDVSVITRAMRLLLVSGVAVETQPDKYAHNDASRAFMPHNLGNFFCMGLDLIGAFTTFPEYVRSHSPRDLYDIRKSPFAFAMGHEGKTYYEILDQDPAQRNLFNNCLQVLEKSAPVLGMFPFKSMKDQVEREPDRPFVVDIGGGRGQALLAIRTECGGSYGNKLILQDLPTVIDTLKPEDIPGIEPMAYDIFTPQPVKNAHIYLMRRLLHDFYDPVCLEILQNTVPAMGPDSRLIVCDMLVPEEVTVGGGMEVYWIDFSMMMLSGKERKLEEFQKLLDAAGLQLEQVYRSNIGETVMLEARRK